MMDDATRAQVTAADPARSTWLTANAGSGKTRVLTDRVARLLLKGTAPERILCLTYTKAAATEMQNRLLKRLGEWAMLPEPELRAQLAQLGEGGDPDLPAARRLFARAIETPGGLKVQTIHSFCAGVLRRFPLEAGVPHGFVELDDRSAALIRSDIIEDMARNDAPELADLLALQSGDSIDGFLASLRGFHAPADPAEIWRESGLRPGQGWDDLLRDLFPGGKADVITDIIPHLARSGANDGKAAAKLSGGDWDSPGADEIAILEGVLLTGPSAKIPYAPKTGSFPTKGLQTGACAPYIDDLNELMERVAEARATRLALIHAERTLALRRFGHAFTLRYEAAKRDGGWLDFDDLIGRTAALLSEGTMAQWVLFRLDGGIDHILVDEAQDTSPAQWQVIQRLTDEFTAGDGARDGERTLFVVGDPKQSIYSFQGADIAVFEERRRGFSQAFAAVERPMQVLELLHSFRSSSAILRAVDAVFAGDAAQGLGEDPPRHIAFRTTLPGRVDLWPAIPKPDRPEPGDWTNPVDQAAENSETSVLARAIADGVRDMLGQPILDAKSGKIRRVRAGDVLVLVQRRADLFAEIIGALKAAGLPVAGADRLKLIAELAVRDIRSTLATVATPEDDLALAEALRSPIFGFSEQELYWLAAGRERGTFLIQRLRDSGDPKCVAAMALLQDLMAQTGYLRPYDLIARLLTRHDGRARLIARLGPEAEDGIDELLSQSLIYEGAEVPSLTGFLVWLEGDDVEVKRQVGNASEGEGLIRVMTVHGSKGLESPIVILPDTAKRRPPQEGRILTPPGAAPIWRGRKGERPDHVSELADEQTERQMLERKRLLYVGLTRAESWLIVAAAGDTGAGAESWHGQVAEGLARITDSTLERIPAAWGGDILRLSHGDWPDSAPDAERVAKTAISAPDWLHRHAPKPAPPPQPIPATALGGAKVIGAPVVDADPQAAMLYGTRLHLLLEHLPGRDPAEWPRIARDLLADGEGGLPDPAILQGLLAEVTEVIQAPDLAQVFVLPGDAQVLAEVALTATLPGIGVITGAIDRLIVTPERLLAVDYKSNTEIPATPQDTPLGIRRQMTAYRDALRRIYPGREVQAAVLWTRARSLMILPDALLDHALDRQGGGA